MTHKRTELVFILDRSGSMSGLEGDTIGGFNATLAKQKAEPGEALITTVLFDDQYELLHDRIPIQAVAPITAKDYYVRGATALLDAVGRTIMKTVNAQKQTMEGYRAGKVLFVIITDGMENASRKYSYGKISSMIRREKEKYGWEFLFLGANIDAAAEAKRFGIGADRAANFHADRKGIKMSFNAVSNIASYVRSCAPLGADCMASVEDDYRSRKSERS